MLHVEDVYHGLYAPLFHGFHSSCASYAYANQRHAFPCALQSSFNLFAIKI